MIDLKELAVFPSRVGALLNTPPDIRFLRIRLRPVDPGHDRLAVRHQLGERVGRWVDIVTEEQNPVGFLVECELTDGVSLFSDLHLVAADDALGKVCAERKLEGCASGRPLD